MAFAHTVLMIGAHHEEFEAECPNLVALLSRANCRVVLLNPIGGWNWTFIRSLGANGRERTIADATAAAARLGAEKVIWDYPVAECEKYKLEITGRLAEFMLELSPDLLFMHWGRDNHDDHQLVADITYHVLKTAPNLSERDFPNYRPPQEIYAIQTGVSQAYEFYPDLLVKIDPAMHQQIIDAVNCFRPTSPKGAASWNRNWQAKANYWGMLTDAPAEALKFIGPKLPLDGFLLKKILGDQLVSVVNYQR